MYSLWDRKRYLRMFRNNVHKMGNKMLAWSWTVGQSDCVIRIFFKMEYWCKGNLEALCEGCISRNSIRKPHIFRVILSKFQIRELKYHEWLKRKKHRANNDVTRLVGSFCSAWTCREIHLADVCRSCRRLCALVIRLAALPRCLSSQFGKLHLTAAQQHQQCPRHSSAGRPAYCQTSLYPLHAAL